MNKQKILDIIKKAEQKNGNKFDLNYDEQTDRLFHYLTQALDLELSVEMRDGVHAEEYWLQCEYYSRSLGKTIIWQYDVGNFDDYDEVADYIIETEKEIAEFERQLPELSPCAYV